MKPISSNNEESIKPTNSSNLIKWEGPDIPCINLCAGDSITEVIYKLATKLCEITEGTIDLSSLDFKCLVIDGSTAPGDLNSTLQLIINKVCLLSLNSGISQSTGPNDEVMIPLPECLQYDDGGDTITELPINDFVELLAEQICTILLDITSINNSLSSLNVRVTELENNPYTPTPTVVTTQCLSFTDTEGESLEITEAFHNFEEKVCEYVEVLGSTTNLSNAIDDQCDISEDPQLSDPELNMSDIEGWVSEPTTIADTLTNLWLTVCDMRNKVISCCVDTPLECIAFSPQNLNIDITFGTITITWDAPDYAPYAAPVAYRIRIYQYDGPETIGALVEDNIYGTSFLQAVYSTESFLEEQEYQIELVAIYDQCGISGVVSDIEVLNLTDPALLCIDIEDIAWTDSVDLAICDGLEVVQQQRKITAILKNNLGANVNNPGPSSIFVNVRLNVSYPTNGCFTNGVNDSVIIEIPSGSFSGNQVYITSTQEFCDPDCIVKTSIFSCILSITSDIVDLSACSPLLMCP